MPERAQVVEGTIIAVFKTAAKSFEAKKWGTNKIKSFQSQQLAAGAVMIWNGIFLFRLKKVWLGADALDFCGTVHSV